MEYDGIVYVLWFWIVQFNLHMLFGDTRPFELEIMVLKLASQCTVITATMQQILTVL
jgi:hypothetical protein